MKKRNIIIIILAVLLLGSVVTCNVLNMEKLYGYKLVKTGEDGQQTLAPASSDIEVEQDEKFEDYISKTSASPEITNENATPLPDNNSEMSQNNNQQNDSETITDSQGNQNIESPVTSTPTDSSHPEGSSDNNQEQSQQGEPIAQQSSAPAITNAPAITQAPTQKPQQTSAPTSETTKTPTKAPTNAPTAKPTAAATATPKATQKPSAAPTATPKPTANSTPQIVYSPLTLTMTRTGGKEDAYARELSADKGKYITIERSVNGNEYRFDISYKADGSTKLMMLFDDGSFSRPQYFYIYDVTASGGRVTAKQTGEYAYSAASKQYMDMKNGRALVENSTMVNLLKQFGINYVPVTPSPAPTSTPAPTAAPTSSATNTPKPTTQPTDAPSPTPFYTGAWKSITLSTSAQNDKWILSSKYNQSLVTTKAETGSHQDGGTTFYDFKFTFTSKDVPGATNVCFAYYENRELDAIEVYRIVIADNGKMSFDRTRSLARGSDGTFGSNQQLAEELATQFGLKWHL